MSARAEDLERTFVDCELERLVAAMRRCGVGEARVAFVLGSGLGEFADGLEGRRAIPYADLEGMPESRVPGHAGRLVLGTRQGVPVVCQQGRVHLYEGWSAREVTRAVRAFARVGVRSIVLTNAAGGLHAEWPVPSLMRVTDHLALQGVAPLAPAEQACACPYDPELGEALERGAAEAGVRLERGVYAGLPGPSYETAAEIRMLRRAGADAVGMSTVQEAQAAYAEGARVAAVSCISNHAAGISPTPLDHLEVIEAGRRAAEPFRALLERALPHLAALPPREGGR